MTGEQSSQSSDESVIPEKKASMAADFSLILGVMSNFCLWVLCSIPAIILGIIALRNIKRDPAELSGRRRAIAGIATACTGLIVPPFLYMGISPNPFHSHPDANRARCILQLQTMEKLMISYGNLNSMSPGDPADPSLLVEDEYISSLPVCPKGGVYIYSGKIPTGEVGKKPFVQCDIKDHFFDH
ncbi:MAG: DUF4190 domain-containing protein [Verrucomicrobia bacterium]|nr:DUF4190 domain-containing protein [Verrucomicrobiota bacterium]